MGRLIPILLRQSICIGLCLAIGVATIDALAGDAPTQWVKFTTYSPLSTNLELVRRFMSPLFAQKLPSRLAQLHERLDTEPLDLRSERFLLFVPSQRPPSGYGLVVFVFASDHAALPGGWAPELERRGLIWVAADRSGNDQDVLNRREPLALLAVENVRQQYRLDPSRIYVAGFSGGSRVAMKIAMAYPDIFAGAVLNAGSDPIGSAETPLPPHDLFVRFQAMGRLVYVTGDEDQYHDQEDRWSIQSMHGWCVFGTEVQQTYAVGHEIATGHTIGKALDALAQMSAPDPVRLAQCRHRLDSDLTTRIAHVDALLDAGRTSQAESELRSLDSRFGGYAAPESLRLLDRLQR